MEGRKVETTVVDREVELGKSLVLQNPCKIIAMAQTITKSPTQVSDASPLTAETSGECWNNRYR
jgi:hypothetical protein